MVERVGKANEQHCYHEPDKDGDQDEQRVAALILNDAPSGAHSVDMIGRAAPTELTLAVSPASLLPWIRLVLLTVARRTGDAADDTAMAVVSAPVTWKSVYVRATTSAIQL